MDQVTNKLLKDLHHWSDIELRQYQLEGVNWMLLCHVDGHGCILGDEMGLGKTCQTIAMLTVIKGNGLSSKPHLVVCPRSVLENWQAEFCRFSPSLDVLLYVGDKEKRADIAEDVKKKKVTFDVLLTTYELCMKDYLVLKSLSWNVLVVDEGHRLKNMESLLYQTLEEWDIHSKILLTGTPVQNNLKELYALLSFVDSTKFKPSRMERFVEKYSQEDQDVSELHELMKPYFMRRTKAAVLADLPEKTCVILYHGMSALQKKLYKAILTKDIEVFENRHGGSQTRLMNILMQLRKCVNHPYLFDGVEPEPFELGEHLVEASHKLLLIDRLLASLKESGHKVLLFSQMARMLDVLQDYLGYRGYTYERLDGSVRGEERFLAVQSFNQNDETFVFLLSTKAGGQGLNLTSADTVIFVDSDFNPQNDLQAAARAHRIGQERPVKVIRLIGKNTVEEIILRRAEEKLKLTEKVIEQGEFGTSFKQALTGQANQLQDILKFGVDELLAEAKADDDVNFEDILGASKNGQWVVEGDKGKEEDMDVEKAGPSQSNMDVDDVGEDKTTQSMYIFEGTDYSKAPSAADLKAFDTLIEAEKAAVIAETTGERSLRRAGTGVTSLLPLPQRKTRKQLSPEELEERRKKRQEAAEKRAKMAEEQEILRAQAQKKRREELWKTNKYRSFNINLGSEGEEEEEEEDDNGSSEEGDDSSGNDDEKEETERKKKRMMKKKNKKHQGLHYVIGDVTHPVDAMTEDNIIVHCTDDSGKWGRGGLFSAISARSDEAEKQYELAGRMKDLALGDCHLIPLEDNLGRESGTDFIALIVAQQRDKRTNKLSGIKLNALQHGLRKLHRVAKNRDASIHLPRIGHDTPGFNWYGTERLLRKHLATKGIPTYIYYFPRKRAQKHKNGTPAGPSPKVQKQQHVTFSPQTPSSSSTTPASANGAGPRTQSSVTPLPSLFSGMTFYFYKLGGSLAKKLKRYVVAYDGDVEAVFGDGTTHVIAEEDADKEELKDLIGDPSSSACRVVTSQWLDKCISKKRILPTDEFLITL